eukprot:TRINITY_DN61623_c0_g1_i2.p1 TRINITY_DN61623_c0_g1~~TRINITY_DN61623_c0_g1_i2.p1  ORF type:complete len:593 (+),score=98.36 TRINITY_DN61623_c0_g1_i2:997-2775(+)
MQLETANNHNKKLQSDLSTSKKEEHQHHEPEASSSRPRSFAGGHALPPAAHHHVPTQQHEHLHNTPQPQHHHHHVHEPQHAPEPLPQPHHMPHIPQGMSRGGYTGVQLEAPVLPSQPVFSKEATTLIQLDDGVRSLKEQFVLRDQVHQQVLLAEREKVKVEKEEREKQFEEELQATKDAHRAQIEEMKTEREETKNGYVQEIVGLEKKLESQRLEMQTLNNELNTVRTVKADLTTDNTVVKKDKQVLEMQLETANNHNKKLQSDLSTTKDQLANVKKALQDYKLKMGLDGTTDVMALRQENKDLEVENKRLEIKVKQLKLEKNQAEERRASLEEEVRRAMETQVEHKQQESKWEKQQSTYTTAISNLEQVKKELEIERDSLRVANERLHSEANALQMRYEQISRGLDDEMKKTEKMALENQRAQEDGSRQRDTFAAREDHYNALDQTNSELRKQNRLLLDETTAHTAVLQEWKDRCAKFEQANLEQKQTVASLTKQLQRLKESQPTAELVSLLHKHTHAAESVKSYLAMLDNPTAIPMSHDAAALAASSDPRLVLPQQPPHHFLSQQAIIPQVPVSPSPSTTTQQSTADVVA